jgi:transposase
MCDSGHVGSFNSVYRDCRICQDGAASPPFPPEIEQHIIKLACERPDPCGRSLSVWDCEQIARQLIRDQIVETISRETVRLRLKRNRLKPWRYKMWLSAKVVRDAAFAARVHAICDLYTRPLSEDERVICLDENTNLQPRPRLSPTLPAMPDRPVRLEHEYQRAGALNLFAAFDTRSGNVYGYLADRKRQAEFIAFLEQLDAQIPASIRVVHVILDNLRMHTGKQVQEWLRRHTRFIWHHPPVHCSWMNQVEQWFSILKRQRLRIVDFDSKAHLKERILAFIAQWNERAHPFRWTKRSFDKILAKCSQNQAVTPALEMAA